MATTDPQFLGYPSEYPAFLKPRYFHSRVKGGEFGSPYIPHGRRDFHTSAIKTPGFSFMFGGFIFWDVGAGT